MRLGIMQPYFMPYLGYWQLMNAVDQYVIYDDVDFIKGGWIYRNRILMNGEIIYFNIPMQGAGSYKPINQIEVSDNKQILRKQLKTLETAYKKAPCFDVVYPIMESIFYSGKTNLSAFIQFSFEKLCEYMEIQTELILSSSLCKEENLHGQEKIISICKLLGATDYDNAIGGKLLYSYEDFKKNGINLSFLKSNAVTYQQLQKNFVPDLSIIDVMMWNDKKKLIEMLTQFERIKEE